MSVKPFVPIFISRTPPSYPLVGTGAVPVSYSKEYRCRNERRDWPNGSEMTGETKSAVEATFVSGPSATFGAVGAAASLGLSHAAAVGLLVIHPAGKEGIVTPSKFCVKRIPDAPRGFVLSRPARLRALSCNWKVGLIVPPQLPLAVKVNGWLTAAPPATRTP